MSLLCWQHDDEIYSVQDKYFLWLRYESVSLKLREGYFSVEVKISYVVHIWFVCTNLRYLYSSLSTKKWGRKVLPRNHSPRTYLLSRKHLHFAYFPDNSAFVFRYVFQRACLRLQRQKQRYKSYVKCAYAHTSIFMSWCVYIPSSTHMHEGSITAENLHINLWN